MSGLSRYLRRLGVEWSAHPTEEGRRGLGGYGQTSRTCDRGLVELPVERPASLATLDVHQGPGAGNVGPHLLS